MNATFKPLVLIPSYNTGPILLQTVLQALEQQYPVWVVIDGSTDGSEAYLRKHTGGHHNLKIINLQRNYGKGGALYEAAKMALLENFTHALTMDSDGQHPADEICRFLYTAERNQQSLIMGLPVFGSDAPLARLYGRKLTIFWTNLETLWSGLGDTLFGFRVYPLLQFVSAMEKTSFSRGFDFDPEIAVRLFWLGIPPLNLPVKCRYLSKNEGGVSHFHYLRDNLKLIFLHFRLIPEFLLFQWINALKTKGSISAGRSASDYDSA